MAYKYEEPKGGEDVIWFRVKSELDTTASSEIVRGSWRQKIQGLGLKVGAIRATCGGFKEGIEESNLKIGDITWVDEQRFQKRVLNVENNRHEVNFSIDCFEVISRTPSLTIPEVKPRYTYQRPLKEVIWLKVVSELIADCGGFKDSIKQCGLKIGDVTWVDKDSFIHRATDTYHVEGNRHCVNFARFCFEAISETPSKRCPSAADVANEAFRKSVDKMELRVEANPFYVGKGIFDQIRSHNSFEADYSSAGKYIEDYLIGVDSSDNPESKLELRKEEKLDRDFTPMNNIN